MLSVGRICLKTAGREAGKYCVVVKGVEKGFVIVTGPRELTKVKRRKCNILHLEPLEHALAIRADASDADVLKAFQPDILTKLNLRMPTKEELARAAEQKTEKEKAKKVRKERERKEREELEKKRMALEKKKQEEATKKKAEDTARGKEGSHINTNKKGQPPEKSGVNKEKKTNVSEKPAPPHNSPNTRTETSETDAVNHAAKEKA